jgi:hypothetical protein
MALDEATFRIALACTQVFFKDENFSNCDVRIEF